MADIKSQEITIKDDEGVGILLEYDKKGVMLYGTPYQTGDPYRVLATYWNYNVGYNIEKTLYEETFKDKKKALRAYKNTLKKLRKKYGKRKKGGT